MPGSGLRRGSPRTSSPCTNTLSQPGGTGLCRGHPLGETDVVRTPVLDPEVRTKERSLSSAYPSSNSSPHKPPVNVGSHTPAPSRCPSSPGFGAPWTHPRWDGPRRDRSVTSSVTRSALSRPSTTPRRSPPLPVLPLSLFIYLLVSELGGWCTSCPKPVPLALRSSRS